MILEKLTLLIQNVIPDLIIRSESITINRLLLMN